MKYFLYLIVLFSYFPAESIALETSPASSEIFINEADADLQKDESTELFHSVNEFKEKGGTLIRIDPSDPHEKKKFQLLCGDLVYPACSGGFCRSQTLWQVLQPYEGKIQVFPPHATRYGYDPYNRKINWHRNDGHEDWADEFELWAKQPKKTRFGYDVFGSWHPKETATEEELNQIRAYYDAYYFSQKNSHQRAVYIAFDRNTHVILARLNQANDNLQNVIVIHLPLQDLVTHPLAEWGTTPRSKKSYEGFAEIIMKAIDLCQL